MSNVVTARISDEILELVDRLAASRDRSRSWIVARLIEVAARKQIEFDDFIQEGADAIERGEYYTQEEMEEWVEGLIASRKKAA